LMRGR